MNDTDCLRVAGSITAIVLPAQVHVVSMVTLPLASIGELSIVAWLVARGAAVPSLDRGLT